MAEIGKAQKRSQSSRTLKRGWKGQRSDVEWIKPFVDEMMVDEVGNMFFIKHGTNSDLPIVLSAVIWTHNSMVVGLMEFGVLSVGSAQNIAWKSDSAWTWFRSTE